MLAAQSSLRCDIRTSRPTAAAAAVEDDYLTIVGVRSRTLRLAYFRANQSLLFSREIVHAIHVPMEP